MSLAPVAIGHVEPARDDPSGANLIRVAVLVGVSTYLDTRLRALPLVRQDVEELKKVLLSSQSFSQVEVLLDQDATSDRIQEAVHGVVSGTPPNKTLFFLYFGGHGVRVNDVSYLCMTDCRFAADLAAAPLAGVVSLPQIFKDLSRLYGTIFITDACHQDSPWAGAFVFPPSIPENIAGFQSSRPEEVSREFFELGHGLFTYYLLEGLRGAADVDRKRYVTVFDLHRYVSDKVRSFGKRKNIRQNPILTYRGSNDLAVIHCAAPPEEQNSEAQRREAQELYKRMLRQAELGEWATVLDLWDKILEKNPHFSEGFSTALDARKALDQDHPLHYENEEPAALADYPHVWPCVRELYPIHFGALVTDPGVRKGDLLLEVEVQDDVPVLVKLYRARIESIPGAREGQVRYYALTEDDQIALSINLRQTEREIKSPEWAKIVDGWNELTVRKPELRAPGVWDGLRRAILSRSSHQSPLLLDFELEPLRHGLKREPADLRLREAAENLFKTYEKQTEKRARKGVRNDIQARKEAFFAPPLVEGSGDAGLSEGGTDTSPRPPAPSPGTDSADGSSAAPAVQIERKGGKLAPGESSLSGVVGKESGSAPAPAPAPDRDPGQEAAPEPPAPGGQTAPGEGRIGGSQAAGELPPATSSALRRQPPPPLAATPAAVAVRQVLWDQVISAVARSQDTLDDLTLDIFITPEVSTREAEILGQKILREGRRYRVVLTQREEAGGRPRVQYYEGPLLLWEDGKPLGRMYGAALHTALFNDKSPENEARLLEGQPGLPTLQAGFDRAFARADGRELRLQLRIDSQASELHELPWEYLWNTQGVAGGPLACGPHTPFARVLFVSGLEGRQVISPDRPLRLLVALASPAELDSVRDGPPNEDLVGLTPLDPSEVVALQEGLGRLGPLVERPGGDTLLASQQTLPVTLAELRQRLVKAREEGRPVHVLHLYCHGLLHPADGRAYLVLDAADGARAELVSEEEFAEVIAQFLPELRLIVLASCFTALPTRGRPLQGVARRLMAAGVVAVIAMQDRLEYEAAQHFSQRLYAQLAHHGVIDRAVNAARRELFDRERKGPDDRRPGRVAPRQWSVPVLFMRIPDGRLFDVSPKDGARTQPDQETRILPYDQARGSGTGRLAERLVQTMAERLGLPVSLAVSAVQGPEGGRPSAPSAPASAPTAAAEDVQRFRLPGREAQRGALERAVAAHRRHPARRTVLFLRALARTGIARLVEADRLPSLTPEVFALQVWNGGHAAFGVRQTRDIADGGPEREVLSDGEGPIEKTSAEWREGHRGFRAADAEPLSDRVTWAGNLTWGRQEAPPARPPDPADLERLLHGPGDPFHAYRELTTDLERAARGLDERTASLLLHAVSPDRFVPYHAALGAAVLRRLGLSGQARYEGFPGYCQLAQDLLTDDLGFEDLADVGYFLQRLVQGKLPWDEAAGGPAGTRPRLRKVSLRAAGVASGLVVAPGSLEQATAALNAGKHLILIGPPGTGKTTLAEDLCRCAHDQDCNRGYVLVTATTDWTTFDTIGGYVPTADGQLVFRPGVFLEAIAAQKWLIIDEINRADIDKAFGELFTVLSGQRVTLPYRDDGRPVRILPPGQSPSPQARDYLIDPSWRILGTMNVYDKASLFAMSLAFMRRFAFVDVAVPATPVYRSLLELFMKEAGLSERSVGPALSANLYGLFDSAAEDNHLMQGRALGPAIARDMIDYLRQRSEQDGAPTPGHLAEALLLYVVPQLDGLDQHRVELISEQLDNLFADAPQVSVGHRRALQARLQELFPYLSGRD